MWQKKSQSSEHKGGCWAYHFQFGPPSPTISVTADTHTEAKQEAPRSTGSQAYICFLLARQTKGRLGWKFETIGYSGLCYCFHFVTGSMRADWDTQFSVPEALLSFLTDPYSSLLLSIYGTVLLFPIIRTSSLPTPALPDVILKTIAFCSQKLREQKELLVWETKFEPKSSLQLEGIPTYSNILR